MDVNKTSLHDDASNLVPRELFLQSEAADVTK